jgi:hypothetical protein
MHFPWAAFHQLPELPGASCFCQTPALHQYNPPSPLLHPKFGVEKAGETAASLVPAPACPFWLHQFLQTRSMSFPVPASSQASASPPLSFNSNPFKHKSDSALPHSKLFHDTPAPLAQKLTDPTWYSRPRTTSTECPQLSLPAFGYLKTK